MTSFYTRACFALPLITLAACGPDARGGLDESTAAEAQALTSATLVAYDDGLKNNFADWSWCTHVLNQNVVVRSGTSAISMQANAYQGLNLVSSAALDPNAYTAMDGRAAERVRQRHLDHHHAQQRGLVLC